MNVVATDLDGATDDNDMRDIVFAGYALRPRVLENVP
jgi:hypothetical protein